MSPVAKLDEYAQMWQFAEKLEVALAEAQKSTKSILKRARSIRREWLAVTDQRDRLAEAILKIKDNAIAIQKIRFGYDGDGGSTKLAEFIEEDCDLALAAVATDKDG